MRDRSCFDHALQQQAAYTEAACCFFTLPQQPDRMLAELEPVTTFAARARAGVIPSLVGQPDHYER
jgi:hypothetical protein